MAATTITIHQYARSILRRKEFAEALATAADPGFREWLEGEIAACDELAEMVEGGKIGIVDHVLS